MESAPLIAYAQELDFLRRYFMKKTLKKIIATTLAATSVLSTAALFAGCESDRPEIQMQIAFNNETYTLEYTLYRKLAPKTVEHFLALVEGKDGNSYFDGLCVHNFTTNRWYTGGYSYNEGSLEYKEYYDVVKTYENFPTSVFMLDQETPTYTVYGEFSKNSFSVQSGALKESFGSLSMFYTDKDLGESVYVTRNDGEGKTRKEYVYNSATSLFYINMSDTDVVNSSYCTFATLNEESVAVLEDLQDAVSDYIKDNYDESSDFTTSVTVYADKDDYVIGDDGQSIKYSVPEKEIKIVSVKVTKY